MAAQQHIATTAELKDKWDELATYYSNKLEPNMACLAVTLQGALGLGYLRQGSVLDLGCGAGLPMKMLQTHVHESVRIVGADISTTMIRLASTRLGDSVKLLEADAEHVPLEDASFDFVYANLCLQTVNDPDAMLREVFRLLKPGGRAGFSVWGRPADSPLMTTLGKALTQLGLPQPAVERGGFYLAADEAALKARVLVAGFTTFLSWHQGSVLAITSGQEYTDFFTALSSYHSKMLDHLDETQRAQVKERMTAIADDWLGQGRPIQLDAFLFVVTKPAA